MGGGQALKRIPRIKITQQHPKPSGLKAPASVGGKSSLQPKRILVSKEEIEAGLCKGAGKQETCVKDVFFSAFSSPKAKVKTASPSFSSSCGFPRIAVAGAKPAFFSLQTRDKLGRKNTFSLCEIQKWRPNSIFWAHRIKRKAALSWQSFRQQDTLGLVGAAEHNELTLKMDQGSLPTRPIGERPKDRACKVSRAPVTYIIASSHLEAGQMVMNCDWSKPADKI